MLERQGRLSGVVLNADAMPSGSAAWEAEMRLRVDRENDALYLRLDDTAVVESEEVQPGVILDFDDQGRVVGIEILELSSRTEPEQLRTIHLETS